MPCPNRNCPSAAAKPVIWHLHFPVEQELREKSAQTPADALWQLMAEGRRSVPAGTTSAHDDFYDENGLPI
jgi:hypothetical protein